VLHAARRKYSTQKIAKNSPSGHHRYIFATKARSDSLKRQQYLPTGPYNMMNFGPLTAEICWRDWGTPSNFNWFRVLAALLHGSLVVGVSQTLRR